MKSKMQLLRFANDLSQDQLSKMTGIDRVKISRLERGFSMPSPEEKAVLAIAFKCSIEQLFEK